MTIESGTSLSVAILAVVSESMLDLTVVENHMLSMMSIIILLPIGLFLS